MTGFTERIETTPVGRHGLRMLQQALGDTDER